MQEIERPLSRQKRLMYLLPLSERFDPLPIVTEIPDSRESIERISLWTER